MFFNDELFLTLGDWYSLFKYPALKIKEKTLIVLDEFSYAVKSDRTILSTLQRAWDHDFPKTSHAGFARFARGHDDG
ncbi:hypothetical protein [Thermococcus waiotapuensis]|uniref:Uncharacterized protein n=1 Tax=Thermococcus waiotapuensis TaxID=90909 RepID=A0AAE4NVY5_9EURY|nr:hypothetical protein [Thermococcus waiotapuensis]MDV3104575.1 hypothetical protein [Thermococcus waiotapuensis]